MDLARIVTVFLFLDDVADGGEIVFPRAGWATEAHKLGKREAREAAREALFGKKAQSNSLPKNVLLNTSLQPAYDADQPSAADFGRMATSVGDTCARRGVVKIKAQAGTLVVLFNHAPNLAVDPLAVWGLCPQPLLSLQGHHVLMLRYTWAEFDTGIRRGGEVTKENNVAKLLDSCQVSSSLAAEKGIPRGGVAALTQTWTASAFHDQATHEEQMQTAEQLAHTVNAA